MSKVRTLLKIISFQREHPEASNADVSSAVGVSERYLRECQKDVRALSFHLSKPLMKKNELDLLMSKLDGNVQNEREILHTLQRAYMGTKDGIIEIASPRDKSSNGYLQIGIRTPLEDKKHLNFWLRRLLYDSLLRVDQDGTIHYRLASECENVEGYSKWRVKLKKNLRWSNGKPITHEDIAYTLARSVIAPEIQEIKDLGNGEVLFSLNRIDALFPYKLGTFHIHPPQSRRYDVTGGPFLLKRDNSPVSYHLVRNGDYYRTGYPKINRIDLKKFARPPFAIQAMERGELDIFPISSLYGLRQWTSISPQAFHYKDLSYYMFMVNKGKGHLNKESAIERLKASIDYNAISLYLSGSASEETEISPPAEDKPSLRIGYLYSMPCPMPRDLSLILGSALGPNSHVVDMSGRSFEDIRAEVDVVLSGFYFGHGYCRIKRFFHSKGYYNIFGFSNPEIDSLIEELYAMATVKEMEIMGKSIIQKLQEENAIILLAPRLEYILSNLYIVPSPSLGSVTDLMVNLSNFSVKRGNSVPWNE